MPFDQHSPSHRRLDRSPSPYFGAPLLGLELFGKVHKERSSSPGQPDHCPTPSPGRGSVAPGLCTEPSLPNGGNGNIERACYFPMIQPEPVHGFGEVHSCSDRRR